MKASKAEPQTYSNPFLGWRNSPVNGAFVGQHEELEHGSPACTNKPGCCSNAYSVCFGTWISPVGHWKLVGLPSHWVLGLERGFASKSKVENHRQRDLASTLSLCKCLHWLCLCVYPVSLSISLFLPPQHPPHTHTHNHTHIGTHTQSVVLVAHVFL